MGHRCAVCGGCEVLLRDCKYCTGVYCPEHAVPERHNCPGVTKIHAIEEWFLTPKTDVPTRDGEEVEPRGDPLDPDEIGIYGIPAPSNDDSSDVSTDGSTTETGGASGTETDGLSGVVSTFQFWS